MTATAQDLSRPVVWPIVNNLLEQIDVTSFGNFAEEVAAGKADSGRKFDAVGRLGALDHMRQVEQDALKMRECIDDGIEQRAVSSANVDDALRIGEIVGSRH